MMLVCLCVCVVAAVADAIRTSLGPRGMDKMVSDDLLLFTASAADDQYHVCHTKNSH